MSSPVKIYIASLQSAFARGDATEHTHRPALKTLLQSNVKGIEATNEPKSSERENKPDYIVRKGASIIGFVEAKDIGKDLKATLKTPQLKRYLEALPNLIVTNYLDFAWFVGGEKRMSISLGEVNGKHIQMAEDADARWTELISSFCNEVTPTVSSPSQPPCVRLVVASNEFTLRGSNNNEIPIFRRIYRAGAGQAAVPWEPFG